MIRLKRNGVVWVIVCVCVIGLLGSGCSEDARLAGAKVPHVKVGPVSDLGMTLDKDATPKQVAFMFLRAIRDDVLAGRDEEAREKALARQFDLCAPASICRFFPKATASERDEIVYRTVRLWAPTLGAYVGSFDFDWETAEARLRERAVKSSGGENASDQAHVLLEVADPSGDANASVIARLQLVRESGFWRVLRVGFLPQVRHVGSAPVRSTPTASAPVGS